MPNKAYDIGTFAVRIIRDVLDGYLAIILHNIYYSAIFFLTYRLINKPLITKYFWNAKLLFGLFQQAGHMVLRWESCEACTLKLDRSIRVGWILGPTTGTYALLDVRVEAGIRLCAWLWLAREVVWREYLDPMRSAQGVFSIVACTSQCTCTGVQMG